MSTIGIPSATVPVRDVAPAGGQWSALVWELERAPKSARVLQVRLTNGQVRSLRSAARWRHRLVHIKRRGGTTTVWLGGRCKGYEEYRKK